MSVDHHYLEHVAKLRRGKGVLHHLPEKYDLTACEDEDCEHQGLEHHHLVDHGSPHGPRHYVHRPGLDPDVWTQCHGCLRFPQSIIHFHDPYMNSITLGAVHHDLHGIPHPFLI